MTFGVVKWNVTDIKTCLKGMGITPTDELIDEILNHPRLESTLTDRMIDVGWTVIEDTIEEVLNK